MTTIRENNLLFVDVESGGLDAHKHSLLQVSIGAFASELGFAGPMSQYTCWVKEDPIVAQPEALKYNGIDLRVVVEHGLTPQDAYREIYGKLCAWRFPLHKKPHMVAWNYALDQSFMSRLARLAGQPDLIHHRCLDLQSVVRFKALQAGKVAEGFKEACEVYGVDLLPPHDAGNDVRMMMDLFRKMLGETAWAVQRGRLLEQPDRR